jgi:two-component system, LuxR family, response regulator FixJ
MAQPPPGTVFVIDDDEAVRDSLKLLLESHCFQVRDFASGPDFLKAVGAAPKGCLVIDLHLPVIGGLDFLSRYRDRLNGMPVILITGKGDPATRARAFEAGIRHFFEKPFEDHELVSAVMDSLARNAAPSQIPAH